MKPLITSCWAQSEFRKVFTSWPNVSRRPTMSLSKCEKWRKETSYRLSQDTKNCQTLSGPYDDRLKNDDDEERNGDRLPPINSVKRPQQPSTDTSQNKPRRTSPIAQISRTCTMIPGNAGCNLWKRLKISHCWSELNQDKITHPIEHVSHTSKKVSELPKQKEQAMIDQEEKQLVEDIEQLSAKKREKAQQSQRLTSTNQRVIL